MTKSRAVQTIFLALALGLFLLSLTQPVWKCGKGGTPFDGISVLVIGFMGLLLFTPAWFCNFIVVVAIVSVLTKKLACPAWLPVAAAGLATTTLAGPYLCGVAGGPLGEGTGVDTGALFWMASIWSASLSVLVAPPSAGRPSPRTGN